MWRYVLWCSPYEFQPMVLSRQSDIVLIITSYKYHALHALSTVYLCVMLEVLLMKFNFWALSLRLRHMLYNPAKENKQKKCHIKKTFQTNQICIQIYIWNKTHQSWIVRMTMSHSSYLFNNYCLSELYKVSKKFKLQKCQNNKILIIFGLHGSKWGQLFNFH